MQFRKLQMYKDSQNWDKKPKILIDFTYVMDRPFTGTFQMGTSLSKFISNNDLHVTNLVCGEKDLQYFESKQFNTCFVNLSKNKLIRNIQRCLYLLKIHKQFSTIIFVGSFNPIFFARKGILLIHDFYLYDLPHSYGFMQYLYYKYIVFTTIRFGQACITTTLTNKLRLKEMNPSMKKIFVFDFIEYSLPITRKPTDTNAINILMVFAKVPNKRWEILLREADRLVQQYPNRYRFTIITNNSAYFIDYVQSIYPELKARFFSHISEDEMMLEYSKTDLIWSASTIEGYGIPVRTASQAGAIAILPKTDINIASSGSTGLYYSLDLKTDPLANITANLDINMLKSSERNRRSNCIIYVSSKINQKFNTDLSDLLEN